MESGDQPRSLSRFFVRGCTGQDYRADRPGDVVKSIEDFAQSPRTVGVFSAMHGGESKFRRGLGVVQRAAAAFGNLAKGDGRIVHHGARRRSEEHTSELQSLR